MGWRIVYIEESEHLSLYLDNIIINKKDDKITIPLNDINTIIIDNYKTTLTIHLINAFIDFNVNVVICDIDHLPKTLLIANSGNHESPYKLKSQINYSEKTKSFVRKIIIEDKIYSQLTILKKYKRSEDAIKLLEDYRNNVKIGDSTNREGLAAKVYFRALFGVGFKRFSEDVINAGLNYGYAILRSQISKALIAKGYNTSLGIFHRGRTNVFNLSDDFIEPFRPMIDSWVYENLLEEKIFLREHRFNLIKQTTTKIKIKGKNQTFFNAINIYIDYIMKIMETGEIKERIYPVLLEDV